MTRRHVEQQPQNLLMRHGLEMLTQAFDVPGDVQRTGFYLVPALPGEFKQAQFSFLPPTME